MTRAKTRTAEKPSPKRPVKKTVKMPVIKKTVKKPPKKGAPKKLPAKKPAPPTFGPFERKGELTWAVLAPLSVAELEQRVAAIKQKRRPFRFDSDEPRHWCVLPGSKGYAAMIDTHLGNASGEDEYAQPLSKQLGKKVYALSFGGYGDPDKGLPYIQQYVNGRCQTIWMADSYSDEYPVDSSKFVKGPDGIPTNDPFAFAKAFGFDLRKYYD